MAGFHSRRKITYGLMFHNWWGRSHAPAAHYGVMEHVVAQLGVTLLEVIKDVDGAVMVARLHDDVGQAERAEGRKVLGMANRMIYW